ncbi:MAG: hypothetical protein ACYTGZ_01285 [Planctomycetota bacterium]
MDAANSLQIPDLRQRRSLTLTLGAMTLTGVSRATMAAGGVAMHRYLPLTAVLLAFWLGRETAADKEEPKVAKFDRVEAKEIVTGSLIARSSPAGWTTKVDQFGVKISGGLGGGSGSTAHLNSSSLRFEKTRPTTIAARDRHPVSHPVAKFGAMYIDSEEMGFVTLYDAKGKPTVFAFGGDDARGAHLTIRDRLGRNRAVLGSTSKPPAKLGVVSTSSESNLTLYDSNGKALTRLPRE